jgi:hypothetical protein
MNYLEFKRQLMVEPDSQDAAFLRARESDQRHREAFAEAMAFEAELQQAAKIAKPDDLLQSCISPAFATDSHNLASDKAGSTSRQRQFRAWLPAMAAGLMMGIGITSAVFLLQPANDDESIAGFLSAHWQYDGPDLVSQAVLAPMDAASIQRILATLNLDMGSESVSRIVYAKNCPTPEGLGVHMVVKSEYGLATVYYIPARSDYDPAAFRVNGMQAQLVAMQHGSVAILGNNKDIINSTSDLLRKALHEQSDIET